MHKHACGVLACVGGATCAKCSNTGFFVTAQMQPFQWTAHGEKNQEKAGITEAHPAQIYCLCKLRLFCLLAFSDSGSIVAITVYVQDVWVRQEKTIWISIGSDFCHTSDYNANPCFRTNTAYTLKSCLSHEKNSHFNLCFIHYVEYKTPNGPYKNSKWFLSYLLSIYENGLVCMVSTFCFWPSCNCTLWHDINQP